MFLIVPPITIQLIEYLDLEPFIITGCFLKPSQDIDAGILYLIVGSASVDETHKEEQMIRMIKGARSECLSTLWI